MSFLKLNIKVFVLSLLYVLTFSTLQLYAADVAKGEALFKQHCTACHKVNQKLVGPALKGVTAKYKDDPKFLYGWIKNNQAMIKSGNPKAIAAAAIDPSAMNTFTFLQDPDIENILAYIDDYKDTPPPATAVSGNSSDGGNQDVFANPSIYYSVLGLAALLIVVALFLVFAAAGLSASVRAREQQEELSTSAIWGEFGKFLKNKFILTSIITIALLGGTLKLIQAARAVSIHPGYMPAQPIKFSHKLHAGKHEINCQYCHTGASKSKNAWVPATNVCMNCHKGVEAGPVYGKSEIAKIYMSAGFNPDTKQYFEPNTPVDKVMEAFSKWMADDAKTKNLAGALDAVKEIGFNKPIEWIRIHNLPDHAYFNHAQHIAVGGKDKDGNTIECQTCHGPIQEMEVVYQYSPLSMGWCVNCHRQSKTTYTFTDPENPKKSFTPSPADMGGLDCAKCHY
ncbi:MAG: c-type cytochrome [Bacteroidia bacterium]|nr:c-type cytochrome [Bacteroidia bacterium]